jgi:DNA-binding transcriptional LysR family regulator
MPTARDVLTPDALAMLETIADEGSFAGAARKLGLVPSALTYRVRVMEDALDVLLFDRSSRQARLTAAGQELLQEGRRLLDDMDAIANRVKRVATGWEPQFTVAVDTIIARTTVMELCESFLSLSPPTRLRLRDEALSGTLEALTSGNADLALGVGPDAGNVVGLQTKAIGSQRFVFAIAPHHPLAQGREPVQDAEMQQHRVVAVADSIQRGRGLTFGLLPGQDVLTVPSMSAKLDAQIRGMGCGFLPEYLVAPHLAVGRLVARAVARPERVTTVFAAWRNTPAPERGRALRWWLEQLDSPATRTALLPTARHSAL